MMFHVYILFSPSQGRHDIGQTGDLYQRLGFHLAHSTPFTAQAEDWQRVFLRRVDDRQEAMALELRIKRAKNRKSIARYIDDGRNIIKRPKRVSEWKLYRDSFPIANSFSTDSDVENRR